MNISKQLKNYRKEFSISQEELAQIIHVSRQTISNWENNRSYPDLQSLLLLSDYFKISLDELIKGDIVNMKKEIEKKDIYKLSYGMLICFILAIFSLPLINRIGKLSLLVPCGLFLISLIFAFKLEKIKKNQDVKTYSEILAYMKDREIPSIPPEKRRKKILREKILFPLIFSIISGLLTFFVMIFFS